MVVIVLLALLGGAAMSRLMAGSAFDAMAARDSMISIARTAQQHAFGREAVEFQVLHDTGAGQWRMRASADAGATLLREAAVADRAVSIETVASGSTPGPADTCAGAFDDPVDDLKVSFDGSGNVKAFSNAGQALGVANGIRLCVNDSEVLSACLSPAGYAHEGACAQ